MSLPGSSVLPYARHTSLRFLLLGAVIGAAFANEYSFNNPQALEDSLEKELGISEAQFQLFYSLYALPNIFTLLFIGHLCDRFGMRKSLLLLSALIALFQLLIAIGGYAQSYSLILAGRILFGVVSEALFIPQASLVAFWFEGKEQALALGIAITLPELGNALNSYLTPLIYDRTQSLGAPLMFSFCLCLGGVACSGLAAYLDSRADRIDEENHVQRVRELSEEGESEEIRLSDVRRLHRAFWVCAAVCTSAMNLWIPFLDNVNRMFQIRFCFTQVTAGRVVAAVYLTTVLTSLPLGFLVDHYGQRRLLMVVGLAVFLAAQTIFLVYPQCGENGESELGAISGLVLEGLGYSFYANVLVGSVPLVTKAKFLGTAFGIMEMLESFFEFLIPLLTGQIVSASATDSLGYRLTSLLFVCLGLVGLGIGSMLFLSISNHHKHKLDRSSRQNELMLRLRETAPELVSQSSSSTMQEEEGKSADKSTEETGQRGKGERESELKRPLLSPLEFQL